MRLVDMEASYLTVEFFRKLPQEMEKAGNPANQATPNVDRYGEGHYRRIGSNVSSYISMISDTLRNTIPKAVVYCQVREAKLSLLNHFYIQIGKKEVLSRSRFQLKLMFPIFAIKTHLSFLGKEDIVLLLERWSTLGINRIKYNQSFLHDMDLN